MTDEREDRETVTDESKDQPAQGDEKSQQADAKKHAAPPTEAIILKSSD